MAPRGPVSFACSSLGISALRPRCVPHTHQRGDRAMRGAEPGGSPAGPCHPPWDPDHRLSTGLPFRCTEQEKSGGKQKLLQ